MKTNARKQVAAFDQVLGHCNALGTKYNPSKDSIKVAALNTLLTSAQASLAAVDNAKTNLIQAVNNRQKVFAPLPSIGTRILNGLIATDASPQLIADIRLYRNKFRSLGKTRKPEESTKQTAHADASRGPVSYLDYESKINNLTIMIELLKTEPSYKPNEPELSVTSLTALLTTLKNSSKVVNDAQVALRNARVARKAVVYSEAGLYGTAKRVKKYILSVFGATSEQYRIINGYSLTSR
jgi:hypothetical protein